MVHTCRLQQVHPTSFVMCLIPLVVQALSGVSACFCS